MNDEAMSEKQTHLIEADHDKIQREAMIRTVLEEPDFASKAFERWRAEKERGIARDIARQSFVEGWTRVAWLAEGRMHRMGREIGKLQKRIARQRKANREALTENTELRERVGELEGALHFYADVANWIEVEMPMEAPEEDPEDPDNPKIEWCWGITTWVNDDGGERARAVLRPKEENQEQE